MRPKTIPAFTHPTIGEFLTDADEKFADSDPRLAIGNYRYY